MAHAGPPACHANTFFREVGGWERKKVCPACPAPWPTARHHSAHFEARARASLGLPARGLVKQDALVTKFIVTSCSLSRPSVRAPPLSLFLWRSVVCGKPHTLCWGREPPAPAGREFAGHWGALLGKSLRHCPAKSAQDNSEIHFVSLFTLFRPLRGLPVSAYAGAASRRGCEVCWGLLVSVRVTSHTSS